MIMDMKPLNLAEVKELVGNNENKDILDYLKKFGKLKSEDAVKLSKDLRGLDNLKMKDEHIVKIVDFLPKDAEDLNKIFNDISLDEKESNEILEIIKNY
jgi:DNA-directed RNA polymerase subunit F